MTREPGFYWVQYRGSPLVAEWAAGASGGQYWYVPGYSQAFSDIDFQRIGTKPVSEIWGWERVL